MASSRMQERANRITRFIVVQLVALIGWIIVQSTFTLSPFGHAVPFPVIMIVETIWWIATLVIMFLLFKRELDGFVQSVLDLEEANRRLRETTNNILREVSNRDGQAESAASESVVSEQEESTVRGE